MKFLFLFFLMLSFNLSASEKWIADSFTGEEKARVSSSLLWLSSYRMEKHNSWFYKQHGVLSGDGRSIYNYIYSRLPVLFGSDINIKICSTNFVNENKTYPFCGDDNKENISNPYYINALPGPYYLWLPYFNLRDVGIEGGIVLSDGKPLPVDGVEDVVLIYNSYKVPVFESEVAGYIYNISHMFAMAVVSGQIKNDILPYETCKGALFLFLCDKSAVGFYASAGLMLRDMSVNCIKCSRRDKMNLSYLSSLYLLKNVSDENLIRLSYGMIRKYESLFNDYDLDVDRLKKLYRQVIGLDGI